MIQKLFRGKNSSFSYPIASTILTLIIVSSSLAPVNAASGASYDNGFTVSPVRNILSIAKGQTGIVQVTVQNPSNLAVTAQAIVNDFIPSSDESGVPRIITKKNVTLPLNNFISLIQPITPFYLGPLQEKVVNVTVKVPSNATAGDYYGVVRFAPVSAGTGVVALNATVATLFLVTVPGNLFQKLSLVQFSAADVNGNTSAFFTNGQLSIVTRLTNQGTTHSEPFGTISIKNMFGKIIDTVQFNSTTPPASILTQSTRKYITALKKQHWFGYYTVTISLGYGATVSSLITTSTTFWYIPLWLEITILVILVLIIVGIVWLIRRQKARKFGHRRK